MMLHLKVPCESTNLAEVLHSPWPSCCRMAAALSARACFSARLAPTKLPQSLPWIQGIMNPQLGTGHRQRWRGHSSMGAHTPTADVSHAGK